MIYVNSYIWLYTFHIFQGLFTSSDFQQLSNETHLAGYFYTSEKGHTWIRCNLQYRYVYNDRYIYIHSIH